MSKEELAALVELLNRVPMTAGEKLWAQAWLNQQAAKIAAQAEQPEVPA